MTDRLQKCGYVASNLQQCRAFAVNRNICYYVRHGVRFGVDDMKNDVNREEKTRIQITIPTALADKIDALCARTGMTRSAWIIYTLGMGIDTYERITASAGQALVDTAMAE